MKTEISRDSRQPEKRYSGVYQQQGRMLTDADWNELVDILKEQLNDALKDVVGNGSPLHRNVVNNDTGTPKLQWGYLYVDGVQALVRPDATSPTDFKYDNQEDFPSPPALPVAAVSYYLYADVWERTVTQLTDERLRDKGLHGADTCTRQQVLAQIKWCPVTIEPETAAKNPSKGNAKATITLLKKSTQPDPCDPCVEQIEVKSRVGNYLFRVEIHDVKVPADAPTEITLKWSGENGAIQYGADDAPEHFTAGGWAYEFFDETSERHLGVHHAPGWLPVRSCLLNEYSQPAAAPKQNVRRWDGYCTLQNNGIGWSISEQYDKDFKETSFASVAGSQLTINLAAQEIVIKLGTAIMAGDFWLAEVREVEHEPGDKLITDALPCGIEHHYLRLGKVDGGVLQANPEAARKYAFPPLTEMTRMFIAGGDGQEAMPGHILPNPIRVGVANGEWPVTGAKVRLTLESGDGALSLSNAPSFSPETLPLVVAAADGLVNCYWRVGDGIAPHSKLQRVKAELLGAEGNPIAHPPIFFNANLSMADEVAYTPQCMPNTNAATVHHLLLGPDSSRLGADGYYTVKEVLDALLCELKAGHIPYDEPTCPATPLVTVKSLLPSRDFNADGHITVKDVLDTLLCKLSAAHVPYDPVAKGSRWDDVNAEEGAGRPSTVQQAIDDLVDNLQSEDIKYTLPTCGSDANTLKGYLQSSIVHDTADAANQYRIKALWDAVLCHLDAAKIPYDPNPASARWVDILDENGTTPATIQAAIDELIKWLESTDIIYRVPDCDSPNTIRSLLPRLKDKAPGDSIKIAEVLDNLLCSLKANYLPLALHSCLRKGPTVKQALDIPNETTVSDVLQKLVCDLDAGKIPYDPNVGKELWLNEHPDNVQMAIDLLLRRVLDPELARLLSGHLQNLNNPHQVTVGQIGAIPDRISSVQGRHIASGSVSLSQLKTKLLHSGSVSIPVGGGYGFSLYDTAISWLPIGHVFPLVSAYSTTNGAVFSVQEKYTAMGTNGERLNRSINYTNQANKTITLYYKIYTMQES